MPPAAVTIVGIAGGSGAGKSWLARQLCAQLSGRAALLSADDYYRDLRHLTAAGLADHNFDCPEALDTAELASHLAALKAGHTIARPSYDFTTHRRAAACTPLGPRPVIVAEGLFLLALPELRRWLDIKIFVDAPEPVRRQRRLARDQAERAISPAEAERQYAASVAPMHQQWVAPSRRWADYTLTAGGDELPPGLDRQIQELLARVRLAAD